MSSDTFGLIETRLSRGMYDGLYITKSVVIVGLARSLLVLER